MAPLRSWFGRFTPGFRHGPQHLIAIVSLFTIAALEQFQPFRQSWLEDHQDTSTDLLHMLVNLSVIQFTAEVLAKLGDAVPASVRLFPARVPLVTAGSGRNRPRFKPVCHASHQPSGALAVAYAHDSSQR